MSESLASYIERYLADPTGLEKHLKDPVLLYEPPERGEEESTAGRRLITSSGVAGPLEFSGEPVVLLVRKAKDNAFQRGITVGRTSNNDLVLDDASVSRFHAWFQKDAAGEWAIADAGSKNGTQLSGQKLKPRKLTPLSGETRIRFGQIEVTFLLPAAFVRVLKARARGL